MTKTMMMAAFALATAGAMPATAQMTTPSTTSGQTDTTMGAPTGTQSGTMSGSGMDGMDHSMDASTAPKMTKSQMAAWKKCQAMPEAKMMKNKSCMKMSKMQGMNNAM